MAGIDGPRIAASRPVKGGRCRSGPGLARRCGRVGQAGEELGEYRVVFVAAGHVATVWELRLLILLSNCTFRVRGGAVCAQAADQAQRRPERGPDDQDGDGEGSAATVEEGGRPQ